MTLGGEIRARLPRFARNDKAVCMIRARLRVKPAMTRRGDIGCHVNRPTTFARSENDVVYILTLFLMEQLFLRIANPVLYHIFKFSITLFSSFLLPVFKRKPSSCLS
jgi:hypothetical protein